MTGYLKLCLAVYWLALIGWISALVSAAVSAMNVFPGMDRLPLRLEQFPDYPVAEHPRLAAGKLMDGVFFTVDLLQFAAAPLVLITLAVQLLVFRLPLRRPANVIRTMCIVIAAGLFAYHATSVAPKMNHALRAFWAAAEAGEVTAAQSHRATFNEYHPTADTLLRLELLLLLAAAVASAAALSPAAARPGNTSSSKLETPELLNRR